MNWTAFDFLFFAGMLGGASLVVLLVLRFSGDLFYRLGALGAVGTICMLVWVSGAVGIIGSEDHPGNLMYLAVLAVAILGAVFGTFQARAMARAMAAAALLQALVGGVALLGGLGRDEGAIWPLDVIGATGVFAAMWLVSAWLFHRAAAGGQAKREGQPG
jgi:hypothetical protein